jgi:predicted RNase H-like HicB family nuclease
VSKCTFTAILQREGNACVALCRQLDITSQGKRIEEATEDLWEAVGLFLETVDSREVTRRLRSCVIVTTFDVGG